MRHGCGENEICRVLHANLPVLGPADLGRPRRDHKRSQPLPRGLDRSSNALSVVGQGPSRPTNVPHAPGDPAIPGGTHSNDDLRVVRRGHTRLANAKEGPGQSDRLSGRALRGTGRSAQTACRRAAPGKRRARENSLTVPVASLLGVGVCDAAGLHAPCSGDASQQRILSAGVLFARTHARLVDA